MRIKEEDFGICAAEASTKEEDFGKVPSQHSVCHKAFLQYKCELFSEAHSGFAVMMREQGRMSVKIQVLSIHSHLGLGDTTRASPTHLVVWSFLACQGSWESPISSSLSHLELNLQAILMRQTQIERPQLLLLVHDEVVSRDPKLLRCACSKGSPVIYTHKGKGSRLLV